MELIFTIDDEKTVTNETVKVTVLVQGQVGEDDRAALEARAREIVLSFLPDASWAFANFNLTSNGMMFQVNASTRIDATENDRLAEKAAEISTRQTSLSVQQIDPSIPLFEIRKAESAMRLSIIEKARAEAELLGGSVERIDFTDEETRQNRAHANTRSFSTANYAQLEAAGSAPLGHSEKIFMTATITAKATPSETQHADVPSA